MQVIVLKLDKMKLYLSFMCNYVLYGKIKTGLQDQYRFYLVVILYTFSIDILRSSLVVIFATASTPLQPLQPERFLSGAIVAIEERSK